MLQSINHPDKLTASKVNYFANYYTYFVKYMGRYEEFEIENILSLIEKIIYQIENNKIDKSIPYITVYFEHELLDPNNKYFKEFKHYRSISAWVDQYRSNLSPKSCRAWLEENVAQLTTDLKVFRTYLKRYMLKQALNSVISFLQCIHTIDHHKEDIQHYTRLIAIELFFERNTKSDILQVFSKILSKEHLNFPFCPTFLKKNKNNLKEAKSKFLESRNFNEQFQGIRNFFREKSKKNFYLFRIGNIKCNDDFQYFEKGLEFAHFSTDRVNKLKEIYNQNDLIHHKDFFSEVYQMYCICSFPIKGNSNPVDVAIRKVEVGLHHINMTCSTSGFLDKKNYIVTPDFKTVRYHCQIGGDFSRILSHQARSLVSHSSYQFMMGKGIKAKNSFLYHEKLFMRAKREKSVDILWQYLENLLKGTPFQDKVANIINKYLIKDFEDSINFYLRECFNLWNFNEGKLDLNFNDQKKIRIEMQNNDQFDFNTLKPLIKNQFVLDLIDVINAKRKRNFKPYIKRVLNEMYAVRNMLQHDGNYILKADLKAWESGFPIVALLRRIVVLEMVAHPRTELRQIFKNLETQ